MIAVPGICITKYGSAWREATLSDVVDLCSVVSRECEEYPLYYENLASHLLELAKQSSDLTIGEYLSYVWEMRRLSGSPGRKPSDRGRKSSPCKTLYCPQGDHRTRN